MQSPEQCKKAAQHKRSAEQHVKDIEDRYVLDESIGIYKPQSCVSENPSKHPGSDKKRPLWTAVVRDQPVFIVSLFTLGLLFATAYFTGRQWQATNETYQEVKKQTLNTEQFFRTDERAWIEFDPLKPSILVSPVPIFGTIYKYELVPKNVGKTPARDIVIRIPESQNGPWDVGQSEGFVRDTQDVLLTGEGRDQTGKKILIESSPIPKVLAPGASSPVPLMLHGPAPAHKGNTINYGYFIGRIDYVDAFNIPHWKKFCFVIFNAAGNVENCRYGNDEDTNPEYLSDNK